MVVGLHSGVVCLKKVIFFSLFFNSSTVPRVVYNGKRPTSSTRSPSSSEIFTPAHEENVRFIYEGEKAYQWDLITFYS